MGSTRSIAANGRHTNRSICGGGCDCVYRDAAAVHAWTLRPDVAATCRWWSLRSDGVANGRRTSPMQIQIATRPSLEHSWIWMHKPTTFAKPVGNDSECLRLVRLAFCDFHPSMGHFLFVSVICVPCHYTEISVRPYSNIDGRKVMVWVPSLYSFFVRSILPFRLR